MPQTSIIRPDAIDVDSADWAASAGTKFACVSDQADGTYIVPGIAGANMTFTLGAPSVAGNVGVERLVVWCRVSGEASASIGLRARFNSVNVNQAAAEFTTETTVQTVNVSYDITFLRPGGGQWTVDDLGSLNIGIHYVNWFSTAPNVIELWVEYSYAEVPLQLPAAREVPSRILRARRVTRENVTGQVPPEFLDMELLTDFGAVHRDAATEDGQGYALAKWKRGLYRLTAVDLDMNAPIGDNFLAAIEGDGLRHYAINLWDQGRARTAGPLQDGAALLDGGQVRTFARGSAVWVPDPSDGRVVAVQSANEAIAANGVYVGRLIEGAAKNYIPQSSFSAGSTPYTLSGTGYNGSAIDFVQYADWSQSELFDSKVSRYYVRFTGWTAGSPAPGHMHVRFPDSDTVLANTNLYLSIDRRHFGGSGAHAELTVWLYRNFDGLWYQWDGTYGAAVSGSTVAATSSASPVRYSAFGVIPSGANNSTFALYVGFDKSLANGKVAYLYHAQLEANSWASSRIVTQAAGASRSAVTLSYTNLQANRIWNATRGSLSVKLLPNWSEGVIAAGSLKTIAFCYHNANNYARLYWDKDNTRWAFEVAVGGVLARAVKSTSGSPVSNTVPVAIAARWTSSEGELGLTAYTLSIFVDGVKGTDAVAAGAMVELDASDTAGAGLHLGQSNGASWLDGIFWDLEISPFVLSDIEIARLAL